MSRRQRPITPETQSTTATRIHRRLTALCKSFGFTVLEEKQFAPYTVDVYLPEFHVALEADGPGHGLRRRKDQERDEKLWQEHQLPVIRLDHKQLGSNQATERQRPTVLAFIEEWAEIPRAER